MRMLPLLLPFFLGSYAFAEALPSLVAYGGTGAVLIRLGNSEKEASVGQTIPYGAIIKTGPKSSVTVAYPDGSLLAIDPDSRVEILPNRLGTQYNALHSGQVRGSIKSAFQKMEQDPKLRRPKFLIRTKAAVLGVRGTEFVMAVDPNGMTTQVHTLEGVVDVASDEGALLSSEATSVAKGQYVEATNTGVSPARPFNEGQYLETLKAPPAPTAVSPGVVFTTSSGGSILKTLLPVGLPSGSDDPADKRVEPKPTQAEIAKDPAAAPQQPVSQQPEQSLKPAEKDGRKIKLASFQSAVFFAQPREGTIRAVTFSWDPIVPIPLTKILSVRGHIGWTFAKDGSLQNKFWLTEWQVFGSITLLKRFTGDVGIGRQAWWAKGINEGLVTVQVGLLLEDGSIVDRIFVSHSELQGRRKLDEIRAGFGITF